MKVIDEKILWKGKFIKAVCLSYEDRNGIVRQWEAVSRVNYYGVVVVIPVTIRNELILIRQFRPAVDNYVIELPAGLVDPEEDILTAGKRELIEETGYTANTFSLFTEGVISTGINTEKWHILLARGAEKVSADILGNHRPDENEDIETVKIHCDDLHEELGKFSSRGDDVDLRIFGLWDLAQRAMMKP